MSNFHIYVIISEIILNLLIIHVLLNEEGEYILIHQLFFSEDMIQENAQKEKNDLEGIMCTTFMKDYTRDFPRRVPEQTLVSKVVTKLFSHSYLHILKPKE